MTVIAKRQINISSQMFDPEESKVELRLKVKGKNWEPSEQSTGPSSSTKGYYEVGIFSYFEPLLFLPFLTHTNFVHFKGFNSDRWSYGQERVLHALHVICNFRNNAKIEI